MRNILYDTGDPCTLCATGTLDESGKDQGLLLIRCDTCGAVVSQQHPVPDIISKDLKSPWDWVRGYIAVR